MGTDGAQAAMERFVALSKGKNLNLTRGYSIPAPPEGELMHAPRATPSIAPGGIVWIQPGQRVQIDGRTISGGFVFVETKPKALARMPFAISPSLQVARPGAARPEDIAGRLGYYPTYESIGPRGRGLYLDWLASDRTDLPCEIGIAFLYFYGLEQRALSRDVPIDDLAKIGEEVRRIAVLSKHRSWNRYTMALLDLIETERLLRAPSGMSDWRQQIDDIDLAVPDTRLRLRIGARILHNKEIPVDEVMAYVLRYRLSPVDAATRATWEAERATFIAVARAELNEVFRNGMPIPAERPHLGTAQVYNRAAHRRQETRYAKILATLPDPDGIEWREATNAVQRAITLVKKYRSITEADGLASLGTRVPPHRLIAIPPVKSLVSWMENAHAKGGDVPAADFARAIHVSGDLTPDVVAGLARFTSHFGYQVSAKDATDPTRAVLVTRETERDRAAIARIVHAVDAVVALRGGGLPAETAERLLGDLVNRAGGTEQMSKRLTVRLVHAAGAPRVRPLSWVKPAFRADVARCMVDLLSAAGLLQDHEWIAYLEDAFSQAKLDRGDLYSLIHAGGRSTARAIDSEKVAAVTAETVEVSSALARIFVDDETVLPEPGHASGGNVAATDIPGLDRTHAALLRALIARGGEVLRADLDAAAKTVGLMPRGAVDTINDWAFDAVGDQVIEEVGDVFQIAVETISGVISPQEDP